LHTFTFRSEDHSGIIQCTFLVNAVVGGSGVSGGGVSGSRVGRGGVTRVGNIGDVTVTIILVVDGLDATIGKSNVVRSRDSLSAAVLGLAHVDVGVVVLNVPGEVVGATDLQSANRDY